MAAASSKADIPEGSRKCIFCKISRKELVAQEFLHTDDQLFVVEDIKPHAPHHYLIIPHAHIRNPKTLTRKDGPLVEKMVTVGREVLSSRVGSSEPLAEGEIRLGFHWPPLNSIEHLHMHVFYPVSRMSVFARNVMFRPGLLFVTPNWLLDRIKQIPDKEDGAKL